jgi:hypothetical protein
MPWKTSFFPICLVAYDLKSRLGLELIFHLLRHYLFLNVFLSIFICLLLRYSMDTIILVVFLCVHGIGTRWAELAGTKNHLRTPRYGFDSKQPANMG